MEDKVETLIVHAYVMLFVAIQRFSPVYNLFFS
jgi:hypothetical protein